MQDKQLEELVNEVNRLNTIFNESTGDAVEAVTLELEAANKRVDQYIKERKEGKNGFSSLCNF